MATPNPLDSFEEDLRKLAFSVFREMDIDMEPVVQRPRTGQADLCLVTFPVAKIKGTRPDEISKEIVERMGDDSRWALSYSGGYVNCNFDHASFMEAGCMHIKEGSEEFGRGMERHERIIVEHTSANPNGPFHVGRARNPIIGDTLVRILRFAGYRTTAQYWVNDMGKQVMILVWGMKNIEKEDLEHPARDKMDHQLVRFYQAANRMMEEDPSVQDEINMILGAYEDAVSRNDWNRTISLPGRPVITAKDVKDACEMVLTGMTTSLSRLNVELDEFVYESRVVEDGSLLEIIDGLKKSGLCNEEDGAFFLDLSEEIKGGDDENFKRRFIFTRSDGSALYTTRDLAYHKWKLENCDAALNILGEDHRYQSQMLSLALRELGSEKFPEVVFYSFVSLPEGKMSTRKNRVVFLDDLLDEAVELARSEVEKRRDDLAEEELASISEAVGIGALRFNMIKVQPEKKITFRWEDALNFEGSTAPFVQYSHARACSILKKAEGSELAEEVWIKLSEPSEIQLLQKLLTFPALMEKAATERKVHLVPLYLVELASAFNEFYRDCPVISDTDPGRRSARLFLVDAVRDVISKGLDSLGITAPDSM